MENNGIIVGTLRQILRALDARFFVRVFEKTDNGGELRLHGSVMHVLENNDVSHLLTKYADRGVVAVWFYASDVTIMVDKAA